MPQKVTRPSCIKCEYLEHCFGVLVSSHLFLLLSLKPYEGKTFLHLSHHMFSEINIMPAAKALEKAVVDGVTCVLAATRANPKVRAAHMCTKCTNKRFKSQS